MKNKTLKPLSLLFFYLLMFSCNGESSEAKQERKDPSSNEIGKVQSLAEKMLKEQKNGGYYLLSKEEATEQMVNSYTKELQTTSYKQIRDLFGNFTSMSFHSMVTEEVNGAPYSIYRFKGDFEKNSNVEVRAVLDQEGKLAGFFVKYWNDSL